MVDVDKIIRIHRKKLYKQVWRVPFSQLASNYGLSVYRLSKICREMEIPGPPVGYWAKIQFSKKIERPALPKLDPNKPIALLFELFQ
jgi:hypothetical protein